MTRLSCLVAVACVALSACSRSAPVAESRSEGKAAVAASPAATPDLVVGDYLVAAPIQHENLTIFPILSKNPRLEDRFVTLDEGLKAGTVEIVERGARVPAPRNQNTQQTAAGNSDPADKTDEDASGGLDTGISEQLIAGNDVNRLTVINRGTKPLYLMPGEIIVGGSQDRTIAEETVIAATGEPVDLEVYCVEHGRWGARDFATSEAVFSLLAPESWSDEDVAKEANQGKFVAKAGTLSKSSRLAVQGAEGQQKVWDEVEKANGALNLNWSSGAFTANYVDPNVVERLKPYLDALSNPISDAERVVGVVVAINGKIETVDVFESTPLFRKLWPQLLKSFALDALHVNDSQDAKKVSTPHEAEAFLASVLHDQKGEDRKTDGGLVVSRHETSDAVIFSAGAMGFGGAAPIHASGYSK